MKKQQGFNIFSLIFGIIVIGLVLLIGLYVWYRNNSNTKLDMPGITITVDKTEYITTEVIQINVYNSSGKTIYYDYGTPFWGLEYYKNNKWINPYNDSGGGFRISYENTGTKCYIPIFDSAVPTTINMKTGSKLSDNWNQAVCPIGNINPLEQRTLRYIGRGKYRLSFIYGYKTSKDDKYGLSHPKTVYSTTFIIK